MEIYQLKCIDLNLNEDYTITNWVKPFESFEAAQLYAESDYLYGKEKIQWEKCGLNTWTSGDIGTIRYEIEVVELGTVNDSKPKMIPDYDLDLSDLKDILIQYMEFLSSDEYHEDNEYDHYIFEVALMTFYGKDIFENYINKIN